MELCKHVETKFIPTGDVLFRPGLKDDSIYVIRNGRLKVYIIQQVVWTVYCTSDLLALVAGWNRATTEGGWTWGQCSQYAEHSGHGHWSSKTFQDCSGSGTERYICVAVSVHSIM